jgi:hypothetical protein
METSTRGRHLAVGNVTCTLFVAQDDRKADALASARPFKSSRRYIRDGKNAGAANRVPRQLANCID